MRIYIYIYVYTHYSNNSNNSINAARPNEAARPMLASRRIREPGGRTATQLYIAFSPSLSLSLYIYIYYIYIYILRGDKSLHHIASWQRSPHPYDL